MGRGASISTDSPSNLSLPYPQPVHGAQTSLWHKEKGEAQLHSDVVARMCTTLAPQMASSFPFEISTVPIRSLAAQLNLVCRRDNTTASAAMGHSPALCSVSAGRGIVRVSEASSALAAFLSPHMSGGREKSQLLWPPPRPMWGLWQCKAQSCHPELMLALVKC